MGFTLDDGKGSGSLAQVNKDNQLVTQSIALTDIEFISKDKGRAFSWSSTLATGGTNVEVIYIKNTSPTRQLIIDEIIVGATANCIWTLFEVTSGTAAGTTITPQNLNLSSGNTAEATSFGNAAVTGSLSGNTLTYELSLANDSQTLELKDSIILGLNNEIALTASANTTVYITIFGYYREVE